MPAALGIFTAHQMAAAAAFVLEFAAGGYFDPLGQSLVCLLFGHF